MNSNSLEYEDILSFDLMACTLGLVVMEWKQTLFKIWMFSDDWLMWYKHFIKHKNSNICDLDLKISEGHGDGAA